MAIKMQLVRWPFVHGVELELYELVTAPDRRRREMKWLSGDKARKLFNYESEPKTEPWCFTRARACVCMRTSDGWERRGNALRVRSVNWVKLSFLCIFILSCVCFCLYSPFNCISFHKLSRHSPLSHSLFLVLFLPYWSFQLYISLRQSPSALI